MGSEPAVGHQDRAQLERCLEALGRMIDEERLEVDQSTVGVELEVALVDHGMRPATRNHAVLDRSGSDVLTSELGSWNLEINLPPRPVTSALGGALERDVRAAVQDADAAARRVGARATTIGILPTLEAEHLDRSALTDESRYLRLDEQLRRTRGGSFDIDIQAAATESSAVAERVALTLDSVAAEAACTSLQLHVQLSPDSLAAQWNAAQAVAGVQAAMSANSPFLLGRNLWSETRVPLFTQAVDTRTRRQRAGGAPPRVWFGRGWASGAHELFADNVRLFEVMLPVVDDGAEDPVVTLDRGGEPTLTALATHNSTVWQWNRPVYDLRDGKPHLRLENRVLPAAPTAVDAAADAAFFYGLVRALAGQDRPVWHDLPFDSAQANLVAGARRGVDAELWWPGRGAVAVTELVLEELLPLAEQGLASYGVDRAAAAGSLSVIEGRCVSRRNGATWQVETTAALEVGGFARQEALAEMLKGYLVRSGSDDPVHTWSTSSVTAR